MPDESDTYPVTCVMEPAQADNVCEMIKYHPEFSGIQMVINRDRKTYSRFQSEQIQEGEVLVTFCIPHTGVIMFDFFREMNRTLNHESVTIQRERAREGD
jgi:hypothetical protein